MRSNQSGFSGAALMMAMGAVGLTTVTIQSQQQKNLQAIDQAKVVQQSQDDRELMLSAAGRFKALVAPKNVGGGQSVPAFFASNYFDENWNLKYRDGSAPLESVNNRSVSWDWHVDIEQNMDVAISKFKGNPKIDKVHLQRFTTTVLGVNRDNAGAPELVTSMDIRVDTVRSGKNLSSKYRVPIPMPQGRDPILKYRQAGSGSFQPVTGNLVLASGNYEFQAFGSGVISHAKIIRNGDLHVKGAENDRSSNRALSWDAVDQPIGSPVIVYVGEGDIDKSIDFDKSTCSATMYTEVLTLPGPNIVRLEVYGVDGKLVPGGFNNRDYQVRYDDYAIRQEFGTFKRVSADDYKNKCIDKCPYYGPDVTYTDADNNSLSIHNYFGNEVRKGFDSSSNASAGDMSSAWTYFWAQEYLVGTQKMCVNVDKPNLDLSNTDYLHQGDFVTYSTSTCRRKFLMTRTTCGCVSEDTKILMGDGKTEKRIDSIVEGETVWNPVLKKAMPIKFLSRGPEKIPMLTLKTQKGELNATGNHPFPTPHGMRTAFQLEVGDEIRMNNGEYAKVEAIAVKRSETGKAPVVWNIEIDAPADNWDAHHYVANGIDTGDLFIQRMMESDKKLVKN